MNRNKGSGLLRGCAVALSFCVATSLFCSTTLAAPESETIEVEPAYVADFIPDDAVNVSIDNTVTENSSTQVETWQTWNDTESAPNIENEDPGIPAGSTDLGSMSTSGKQDILPGVPTDISQTSVSKEETEPGETETDISTNFDSTESHVSGEQIATSETYEFTGAATHEPIDHDPGDRIDLDLNDVICKPSAVPSASPEIASDFETIDSSIELPEGALAVPTDTKWDVSNFTVTETKDPNASADILDQVPTYIWVPSDSSFTEAFGDLLTHSRPTYNADQISAFLQAYEDYEALGSDASCPIDSDEPLDLEWINAWIVDKTDLIQSNATDKTTVSDETAVKVTREQLLLLYEEIEAHLSGYDKSVLQKYVDKQMPDTSESVQAVQMIAEKIERIVVSFTATMDMPVSIETEKDFVTAGTEEPLATAGASEGAATVAPQETGEIAPSGTEGQTHPVNSSMTSGSDDPTRPTIPPTFIQETTAAKNESVTEPEKAPVVEPPKDTQTADTTQTAETGVPTRPSKPSGRPLPANNNASVANVQTASLRTDTPAAIAASIENLGASGAPTRTGGSASLQTLKKIPTRNSNRALSSARLARNLQATQPENLLSGVQEDVSAEEILIGTRDGFWLLNASSGSRNASMENWVEIEDSGSALSEGWSAESIGWTILESLGAGGITLMIYKICRIIPDPKLIWFLLFGRKKKKSAG